jgi:polysaccharide export outer membrane protein
MGLALAGCAKYSDLPAGTVKKIISTPIVEQEVVSIPPLAPGEEAEGFEYRVGPGDVLVIRVPGLVGETTKEGERPLGFRVYSSGKILLPLAGGVKVAGLTVEEIQEQLQEVFSTYLKKPAVTVEIGEFKSQPLYLLGKFNEPGVKYLDRPINLIQGIVLGGGLNDSANLRGARLVRDDKILPVDIYDLLYNNDLRQNIRLRANDTIYVPGNEQQNVFVFGAVGTEGPVPMLNGRLSLMQALTTAGLSDGGYDHQHVRIIRSYSPTRGQLMVADLGRIMNGDAMPFPLADGDIVYVPRGGVGDWNQTLKDLLPTLQTVSSILQPFVQIKFLTDDD